MSRRFIAHRGVHLDGTIAGENSLEAIHLARRAGFACIETDVRLSSDGEFVVMHDATLTRTASHADGSELREPVAVAETSLARLRNDFRLKARDPAHRSRIPTLEEYLKECAQAGLRPFIEIKPADSPTAVLLRLIELADEVLGRGGYVLTSNGSANRAVRKLGIRDVPMMDILAQAPSFEDVAALGDVIIAISATRFSRAEHLTLVERARRAGLATETHADDVVAFAVADEHQVDLISTDVLAPDLSEGARVVLAASLGDDALHHEHGEWTIGAPPLLGFGAVFLELQMEGSCEVRLGPQRFELESRTPRRFRHQVMVADAPAHLSVATRSSGRVDELRLTVAEY